MGRQTSHLGQLARNAFAAVSWQSAAFSAVGGTGDCILLPGESVTDATLTRGCSSGATWQERRLRPPGNQPHLFSLSKSAENATVAETTRMAATRCKK
jgi:hypothetical protein